MDGKQITRASAHNYGYMIDNKISIGTKVILSLAGDIIPFIYKVTNTDKYDFNKLNLPDYQTSVDGCHLYKIQTPEEYRESCFIQSANALNIPQIGPAAAKTIYDYIVEQSQPDEFFDIPAKEVPNNILSCSSNDIYNALGGKLGKNAMKSFIDFKKNVTLSDVIVSCTFESCGRKIADAISDYLLFGNQNFEHMAEKAWSWCLSQNSKETITLYNVLESAGLSLDMFKIQASPVNEQKSSQIPVILTGEPNDYRTKADFLAQHPEYRLTTSWKEVKIVFTNDLNSRTGKMKKAIEKNIEIRLY
jgi:NAD-dependent DNA ligase